MENTDMQHIFETPVMNRNLHTKQQRRRGKTAAGLRAGFLMWLVVSTAGLTQTGAARAEEISVSTYGSSFSGLPYAIAMERSLFQKAGIDVTGINGSGGGGTTLRNVLASELPYGEVALSAALAAKTQGLDVIIVDVGFRTYGESALLTRKDSDIKSLADLAGKKVAITNKRSLSEMLLILALTAKGVDPSTVTFVSAGGYGQALTMLDQGAVVAAPLIIPMTITKGDKYNTLVQMKDVLPPMTGNVGVTTSAFAKAHPEKIKALIAGRRAAVKSIYDDPDAAAKTMATFLSLPPDVAQKAVQQLIAVKEWSEGNFDVGELERAVAGLRLVGEVKDDMNWKSLIDQSYLPDDLKTAQ
jgi:NitT/TauT family transport system substrate-binding protein